MSRRVGPVLLSTVAREWARIGVLGFGGPPAHITMLRATCVDRRAWLTPTEFEDGVAATNLLPGPASTQLAIFCAWRIAGVPGALVGGIAFIGPGLALIIGLAAAFLASNPPTGVLGAAAGAGAAVPAVALAAALALLPASWARTGSVRHAKGRWIAYVVTGAGVAAAAGPYLVLAIAVSGLIEIAAKRSPGLPTARRASLALIAPLHAAALGGLAAVAWVAFKVGALSYGGGFVIVPLMQHDAVSLYHWMTPTQFLGAVALGQLTPGPVVHTVAVVGYASSGLSGALVAAALAFAPSFLFVLLFAPHFDRLRASTRAQSFLTGAGACAIGSIAGASIPLALALVAWWQLAVLAVAALWLLGLRRGTVPCLVGAAAIGAIAAAAGAPISH